MKAAWLLLGLGACVSDALPPDVQSSRTIAMSMTVLVDGRTAPPKTDFILSVTRVGDINTYITNAAATAQPDGDAPISLPLHGNDYEASYLGTAARYSFDVRSGKDYVDAAFEMPPLVTLHTDGAREGQPVTVTWGNADPTTDFTLTVMRDGTAPYAFAESRDNNPDPGQYVIPGTVFDSAGDYTIEVQRSRTLQWWDDSDCGIDDCTRTLSGILARTYASTTLTL